MITFLFFYIILICMLNTKYINGEESDICKVNEGIKRIFDEKLMLNQNSFNYNEFLTKYDLISKDNDAYLLLFRLFNLDKNEIILLLNNDNKTKNKDKTNQINKNGFLINKYSLKTWSDNDIVHLKELINKNNRHLIFRENNSDNLSSYISYYNIQDNILRINYTNKLLLEGGEKEIRLLPNMENKKKLSNELAIYADRSLIKINDNISGINIKQLLNLKEMGYTDDHLHSSYSNSKMKGIIRYYKLNKGSFGEVWRGLGFKEYLNEPYGECSIERIFTIDNFIWRRGELINHELHSLIIDVLNMIKINENYYISLINERKEKRENEDINNNQDKNILDIVMKRMNNELDNMKILYSVVREVFFGILLYCLPHISRFLHLFEEVNDNSKTNNFNLNEKNLNEKVIDLKKSNIWLVYRYEGINLNNLIFEIDNSGSVKPSEFWWKYIKSQEFTKKNILKSILHQIFIGLSKAHQLGIVHRDIKPSNIFVTSLNNNNLFHVRIGDWGSAMIIDNNNQIFENVDISELNQELYGEMGISSDDETEGFQPPEVQFKSFSPDPNQNNVRMLSYDIWSVGVIMLQIIWGNMEVFSVLNEDSEFQHITKKIVFHIKNYLSQIDDLEYNIDEIINDSIYRLSLMRLCLLELSESKEINKYGVFITHILKKSIKLSTKNISHDIVGITKDCEDTYFLDLLKKNDISGVGLNDLNAIHLIKQLLKPRYNERINIKQVLKHPYFA